MSVGGGCEAAMTARTRCGWVMFWECDELLYGKRFPLRLKGAFYETSVRPAILHGSKAWCLEEGQKERSIVRAISEYSSKIEKRSKDLMLMLGLNETINQLDMASC